MQVSLLSLSYNGIDCFFNYLLGMPELTWDNLLWK